MNRKAKNAKRGGSRPPTASSAGIASLVAVASLVTVDAAGEAPGEESSSAAVGPCTEQAEGATVPSTEEAPQPCPAPATDPVDEPPPAPTPDADVPEPPEPPEPAPEPPAPAPEPEPEAGDVRPEAREPSPQPAATQVQQPSGTATASDIEDTEGSGGNPAHTGPAGHGGRGHGRDHDRDHRGDGHDGENRNENASSTGGTQAASGSPTAGHSPTAVAAPVGSAPFGYPTLVTEESPIPPFLIPIYEECGRRYDIPWQILAAINQVETAFGSNLNVSSAGAMGWMQFMPATWRAYGVDANGDGRRDPYDPEDAICAAANYLSASGAPDDMRGAIFAYNHANWYVEMVLGLAHQYSAIEALDPLPRTKRLDRDFALGLARQAREHRVDWAQVLAVLRLQGASGPKPATPEEIGALAAKLADARPERGGTLSSFFRSRPGARLGLEPEVRLLARYNRAIGLRGLVHGLNAVRTDLAQRALDNAHLSIYAGGRTDIERGTIDVRVLTLLLYLAEKYDEVTVTSLTTGHGYYARPGVPSAHSFGRAVDIAAIDGTPILGNQGPGSVTDSAVRQILRLPDEVQPAQVISLLELGGPSFAAADHADHIHVGY